MLVWIILIAIVFVVCLFFGSNIEGFTVSNVNDTKRVVGTKLWMDHMNFTRELIIGAFGDVPFSEETAQRLFKNQDDLARFFSTLSTRRDVYPVMRNLLNEHISVAIKIVQAVKEGDNQQVEALSEEWKRNAKEIAAYLATLSPNYKYPEVENYFLHHLETTTSELKKIAQGSSGIPEFDEGVDHMLAFNSYILSPRG